MTDGAEVAARRRRGLELMRAADGQPAAAVTVLGSFNLDLLPPYLVEALDRRGLPATVACGPFGQIAQSILDPDSDVYRTPPSDLVVVPAPDDLLTGAEDMVDARLDELSHALTAALERLPATTIHLVAFPALALANASVLDPLDAARGQASVTRFVDGVRALGGLSPRVVVVDFDWHARGTGLTALTDARLWYMGRMRLGPVGLAELAEVVARHLAAARGQAHKVAVVDLDGTLWGGVLGEEGPFGIDVGDERAGLAYQDFQRELLTLRESGTVLAIASKNDREPVVAAFAQNPSMVLRLEHFAADRIDWRDKATSLRELADELSLGLDSFVFLDDNPVEREWVRQALPQVTVPELPADPALRPGFLRDSGLFDRIALTAADGQRAASYAAMAERNRLRDTSTSYGDFLGSLEQRVTIAALDEATLPRAAQLCARTNQFNLTTHRHTAAELEAMSQSGAHELYTVAVNDRFADSGVTGLAILELSGDEAEVETLLLSCRVLGRRVEDAVLAVLAERAAERGAEWLVGVREPTDRNGQTERFYAERGFESAGPQRWRLDLSEPLPVLPDEMTIEVRANAQSRT